MRLTEDILQLSMLESELKAENTTQIELAGAVKDILPGIGAPRHNSTR